MRLCPRCNAISDFNSYFHAYVCTRCAYMWNEGKGLIMADDIKKVTLTAKEAAFYIGCSYWLLLEMVKRNEIPCIKAGNKKLFRAETLDKWMDKQEGR